MAGKHLVTIYSKKGLARQFKKGGGKDTPLTLQQWESNSNYSKMMALVTSEAF